MRRREFITLLGSATASWSLAAQAQQAGKLPTIGFLGADASAFSPWTAAFVARLAELGWIEGKTIAIEYRWSQGRSERYAEIAAEFVRLKVDVIVTVGSAVPIVRQATTVIPIVFAVGIDPVGSGLVASLAQPGGNVTGLSIQANELAGKRLEFARELVPQLHRLAIMFNFGNAQPVLEMGETQAAARMLGLEVAPIVIQRAEDIAPAFQGLKTRADALYVAVDQLMVANRTSILTSALSATDQATRNGSGARQTTSTRSCVVRSPAISRSSSQPSSSSSSILRPPRRWASTYLTRCSPALTR
jgi:putative ABC transport system substrate-binding protein